MPTAQIKALAEKHKVSVKEVEMAWEKAKTIVDKQYPKIKKGSPQYYKLVYAITERMLPKKEGIVINLKINKLVENLIRKISLKK